jgi:hypothetical protein
MQLGGRRRRESPLTPKGLGSPNWARAFSFTIANNLRQVEDIQSTTPQAIREGEFAVTGRIERPPVAVRVPGDCSSATRTAHRSTLQDRSAVV